MLRWLKTVVVSDEEKALVKASGGDREGERERIVDDVSKLQQVTSEPGREIGPGAPPTFRTADPLGSSTGKEG